MSVSDFEIVLDDGLRIAATDDPGSGIVETFYELYDRAFVLPNEKEPITGRSISVDNTLSTSSCDVRT